MSYEIFNPESLGRPSGWSNGLLAPAGGRLLFVAGQTARLEQGRVPAGSFVEQFGQALDNILPVVHDAGGDATDIGRFTIFVADMDAYRDNLQPLGVTYRARMGRHYPAMALVEVARLVDPNALVEIEATAVISPPSNLHDGGDQPLLA